ncbi:MAG: cytokinesis protein 3 [Thelocarpon superellum]|nr:MAG: cytokinesis protein 3 [Thelocarpon superellum]
MAPVAAELPIRFPCWCRAVYSWGGEVSLDLSAGPVTKRDLGFIEGDLIECLNAGDGSWWMGRLKRDRRMMGLFPSNFVRVLEESYRPDSSRGVSPAPSAPANAMDAHPANGSHQVNGASAASMMPQRAPGKSFRKPFAAYTRTGSRSPQPMTRESSRASFPNPLDPLNQPAGSHSRLPDHGEYPSRGPSPTPSWDRHHASRGPSPQPYQDAGSSPPPAPPPHRIPYDASRAPSPSVPYDEHYTNGYTPSRPTSAVPRSPNLSRTTPSPLRDAMEDVMSSLKDMSVHPPSPPSRNRSPLNPWSPEAFDQQLSKTFARRPARPVTSLGFGGAHDHDEEDELEFAYGDDRGPLQPDNYVHRMERRLQGMQQQSGRRAPDELFLPSKEGSPDFGPPPAVPPKRASFDGRPVSSLAQTQPTTDAPDTSKRLKNRKSAYELGRQMLGRTFTTRSTATNSSSGVQSTSTAHSGSTQLTSRSVMSGQSAGGVSAASAGGCSATSAGSLARRRGAFGTLRSRPMSVMETTAGSAVGPLSASGTGRPETPLTGVTFHSGYDTSTPDGSQAGGPASGTSAQGPLGGLMAPRPKKSGFFKKIMDTAKTSAASARSSIAPGHAATSLAPTASGLPHGVTAIAGGMAATEAEANGGGTAIDWVQVRRDVNRSNSLSRNERVERQERCQMLDRPCLRPVDELRHSTHGDEGVDGRPVEGPTNFQAVNLTLVDKSARFVNNIPPMTNPISLAQGYLCRPYRSDVQRLRAIFIWVSEKISWEEDFEGEVDSRRVIQLKRGCAEEVAVLVLEMCQAMGMHAEVVRGHLKAPGETMERETVPRPDHWWNAVMADGEWRIMDCSLASPTHPRRSQYSSSHSQTAEAWWFLTRPLEACYTHVPMTAAQQHLCPPVHQAILMALPCACAPFFRHRLQMRDYDTSLLWTEELEQVQLQVVVPHDVECVAEVEARAFERDADGDLFESGDVVRKRALAQAEWIGGQKRYTVKALLPGDEGQGVLKVYAGKRGLMHSIKDNPHPLAFAVPIVHHGQNPAYDFLTRHPTPHAQRHDLYVAQPQCARLAVNNTFVFAVRQHPSAPRNVSPDVRSTSPIPFPRPSSAMSLASSSAAGGGPSSDGASQAKPAKLAVQAPSGKILRLMRKNDHTISTSGPGGSEAGDGGVWETIIKCGERGVWRGLVLADRSARWCVFAEWTCV